MNGCEKNKALLIYNARLVDEELDTEGAVLVFEGKIKKVFNGRFSTKKDAESLVKDALIAAASGKTASSAASGLAAASESCKNPYSNAASVSLKYDDISFYDAEGLTLMPAFIDMHVHLRYPGQTQKEDLHSGLKAAAAGGVGTLVAMANTLPTVSSGKEAKKISEEGNTLGLSNMFQAVSLTKGFKGKDTSSLDDADPAFSPVVSEDGRDVWDSSVMLEAMKKAVEKNLIVSCHSEDPSLTALADLYRQEALAVMREYSIPAWGVENSSGFESASGAKKLPPEADAKITKALTKANEILAVSEDSYTERNLLLSELAHCRVHIAHVSTKKSMDAVRRAKERFFAANKGCEKNKDCENGDGRGALKNCKISCEVTPHHLALCGTFPPYIRALVNPPLRAEDDRKALIEALRDGTADVISTDHAPHTFEDKSRGSPGFSGLETSYAVCNTVLVRQNGFTESRLSRLMSAQPARILGLKKGRLSESFDADLVLTSPSEKWRVSGENFFSKGKATPFEGKELFGRIHATFIGGKQVFKL
ncbi:dihydroorotase [Treponema parvum]|uniref:Dihydroorotase n=1 Tax=Treponema parvum TaxID=138851 RepID=A0A975EXY1_9SPIR|nr:dihydroorotase [Treponema parvum]QTQ10986.1 dihydroorotase [Treponema parvum]